MNFFPENLIELDSLPLIGGIIWIVLIILIPILLAIGIRKNKVKQDVQIQKGLSRSISTKGKGFEI